MVQRSPNWSYTGHAEIDNKNVKKRPHRRAGDEKSF